MESWKKERLTSKAVREAIDEYSKKNKRIAKAAKGYLVRNPGLVQELLDNQAGNNILDAINDALWCLPPRIKAAA